MKIRTLIVTSILVLIASLSVADHAHDLARAEQAYASGDYELAYHSWLAEAEHGDARAQEMVAAMNAAGKGAPQNYMLASEWYRKSAVQGNSSAQFSLGNMYAEGQGVSQSNEHAYAWWLIAGANGMEAATMKRKDLEAAMSQPEIERAQGIAIEFMMMISN